MTINVIPTSAEAQPDIAYHPDEAKWRARTARRLTEDPTLPMQPLPEGFPQQVDGPIVWEGKDFTDEDQWIVNLTENQLHEIDGALRHFQSKRSLVIRRNRVSYSIQASINPWGISIEKLSHYLVSLLSYLVFLENCILAEGFLSWGRFP